MALNHPAQTTDTMQRVNGHVMSDHEAEAHTKLLQENTMDDDDEEIAVSVHVPPISAVAMSSAAKLDSSSGTHLSLDARGGHVKRLSSSSIRGTSWKLKYQDFLPAKKSTAANWTTVEQYP